jgi:hypothetical protein
MAAALAGTMGVAAAAQYPGQVAKPDKDTPQMRAVAVLEWTGAQGQPKTSRLVPITVFDGSALQDGGLYLAHPEPLSLEGEVEYQLKTDGKNIGLFDVENAAREQGQWVGYGKWKPLPAPKQPAPVAKVDEDDAQSDRPTLHRKHDSGGTTSSSAGSSGGSGSGTNDAPVDPDRPTLHKKSSSDDSGTADAGGAAAQDPDRPVLHKSDKSKKDAAKPGEDVGHVEDLPDVTDPDRPRLMRGKFAGGGSPVLPSLMGLPPDMQQTVAVSDARNTPEHPWTYSWANPEDESKLKAELEDIARKELGLTPPPSPKKAPAKTATKTTRTRLTPAPAAPAPLDDEVFRVFELAYGSGATMVLSARTEGAAEKQKYVTLIAQPDLYGSLQVLYKSVTDGAHLDDVPRMRLVDAVDAMADNRGELLFELRGATDRQFALFRVMRGAATKLFVTGGNGSEAMN